MNLSLNELCPHIESDKDYYDILSKIQIERITYSKEGNTAAIYCFMQKPINVEVAAKLKAHLGIALPQADINLFERFDFALLEESDIKVLFERFDSEIAPVNGYLANAVVTVAGRKIEISVKIGKTNLDGMKFSRKFAEYIKQFTNVLPEISLTALKKLDEDEVRKKMERRNEKKEKKSKTSRKGKAIPKKDYKGLELTDAPPELLYGADKFAKSLTKISDLNQMIDRCTICGDVFDCEVRDFGRISVFTAKVTDGTNSVLLKHVVRFGEVMGGLSKISKGDTLLVQGNYTTDPFLNCAIIDPVNVALVERFKIVDSAEVKRVELHLHTKLSSLDAICDPGGIVREAARIGHNAIAITDHGVVQGFPEAMLACKDIRRDNPDFKVIYGLEAYFVNDDVLVFSGEIDGKIKETEFVVFDIETTGLSFASDAITQIGAVVVKNGETKETFDTFVNPEQPISAFITKLTGITNEMVADAPSQDEAIKSFVKFVNGRILVAHNGHSFDMQFIKKAAKNAGVEAPTLAIDTLPLAHKLYKGLSSYKLNTLSKQLGCKAFNHHRALDDALALADIFLKMIDKMSEKEMFTLQDMNEGTGEVTSKQSTHLIILAKNKTGLKNLYKLVSASHIDYFARGRSRGPRIPRSLLNRHREGLILGSACEAGELYRAVAAGRSDDELLKMAEYYDYLEIQPLGNNEFMVRKKQVEDINVLKKYNKKIIWIGKQLNKPVVATGDVHFPRPEDAVYRAVLQAGHGYDDFENQAPLYLRTTREMLDEFSYLTNEEAHAVVVTNPNLIADMVENILPIPEGTFAPTIEGADETLRETTMRNAHSLYGETLPKLIEERLEKELGSIIIHGYAVLYVIAQKLVKHSEKNGYHVGSRGSVGSSAVAFFAGISEVNPLPAHYICPKCQHSNFDIDKNIVSGFDLPAATCPTCGEKLKGDGNEIPFETFLGFDGDKEPDIDLNFSGEFQAQSHKYTEELFGKDNVYKAGTVSGLQEKTAFGYVKKYLERSEKNCDKVEIDRLVSGIAGVKRTTGQHPGGMVVVPNNYDIYDFCPIQYPADDKDKGVVTTHFEFKYLHETLLKLDELGHDIPTKYKHLEDMTGLDMNDVPLNDPEVISLLVSPEALGVTAQEIDSETGTFAIPELGTNFVRQMLLEAQPKTFGDLIQISGLSHGTDVWSGNAQDLIKDGTCTISQVIGTRDSIMTTLVHKGVEPKLAFDVMEMVRKGVVAKNGFKPGVEDTLRSHGVEEWYLESCKKIKYMFPKAHAVAYLIAAMRMMWFKINEPLAFYATEFTARGEALDYEAAMGGKEVAIKHMRLLKNMKKEEKTAKDEDALTLLQIMNEYQSRGFEFLPICLGKSYASKYVVEEEKIRLPFSALRGIGDTAANALEIATIEGQQYLSIEEIKGITGISTTVAESLKESGVFAGMPDSNQLSFF